MNFNGEEEPLESLPERVEGWLNVLDVPASGDISLLQSCKSHSLQWCPMYCVLRVNSQRLSHSKNEDRGLQKKCAGPSVLRIAGTLDDLLKSSEVLPHYNKEDEHESKHGKNASLVAGVNLEDNSSNRFMKFINRTSSQIKGNLKRTRSSTKLDGRKGEVHETSTDVSSPSNAPIHAPGSFLKRTRSLSRLSKRFQNKWRGIQDRTDSSSDKNEKSLRSAQSHESLVGNKPVIKVTILNSHTDVKVIHMPAVLSKENCFLISTDKISRYYSCPDARQMSLWLTHLRRSLDPVRTLKFRVIKSISVMISEAKNLSNKQRHFCELSIDGQVYGRTTTKSKGDMLFWGEEFQFRNLHALEKVDKLSVNVFQDAEKKKKKDLSILLGCISIPLSDLNSKLPYEKWYPIRMVSSKSNPSKEPTALIRIRVKYQSLDVLPLHLYLPLLQYLESHYISLVSDLDEVLNAKEKEELSSFLVNIFRAIHRADEFLVNVVMWEVNKQEKVQTILRSNSIASKSIDAFMKLVSEKYLKDILGGFVASLMDPTVNLEVDNISSTTELSKRQEKLLKFCNCACSHIFTSTRPSEYSAGFPTELQQVFSSLRKQLTMKGQSDEMINQILSSCFFLRFICPAILSPSLFGLARVLPQDKDARNCTLIAKAIQGLANFSRFGEGKEESMVFLNSFVELQTPNLKKFIEDISTSTEETNVSSGTNPAVEIGLDLGRELSLLHGFLKDVLENKKISESCKTRGDLLPIFSDISMVTDEQKDISKSNTVADSLDDLTAEEGTPGKRRTMRQIQESGSYISFTSLQNIPAAQGRPIDHLTYSEQRLLSNSTEDRFSMSSSRFGQNGSSSCVDVRSVNAKSGGVSMRAFDDPRSMLEKNRSSSGVFIDDVNHGSAGGSSFEFVRQHHKVNSRQTPDSSRCSHNAFSMERSGFRGPSKLIYAAETEIDGDYEADSVDCLTPSTPEGSLMSFSGGDGKELQITFNLSSGGLKDSGENVQSKAGSLKRPAKGSNDQQQPLIFSNPGFGMKSSLSQSSLKMDVHPSGSKAQSPGLKMFFNLSSANQVSHASQESVKALQNGSGSESQRKNYSMCPADERVQTTYKESVEKSYVGQNKDQLAARLPSVTLSKSMEFNAATSSKSTDVVLSTSTKSVASPAISVRSSLISTSSISSFKSPETLLHDNSTVFTGRGDMGLGMKPNSQNWSRAAGVRTIPRKTLEGDKDHEVTTLKQQLISLKSSLADTKWKLQQESEARTRMEADYERKLRISEEERKKMEAETFEDKKRIKHLTKQLQDDEIRKKELEKKLEELVVTLNKIQQETRVSKVAKKWPEPV